MKKWLILFFSLFFLTACGSSKGLSEKEAANVFVDAIFYNKQSTLFKENFSDAQEALQAMHGKEGTSFTREFIGGITRTSNISETEAKKISDSMEKVVKEQTKYNVKSIKEKKTGVYQVTYEVYGVDFIQGFKSAMNDTFEKLVQDPTLSQDQTKIEKELALSFSESIQKVGAVKKPVEVQVELTKNKDKWSVANSQMMNLQNLIAAFWLGAKDQQSLIKDITDVTTELSKEFQEKMLQGQ